MNNTFHLIYQLYLYLIYFISISIKSGVVSVSIQAFSVGLSFIVSRLLLAYKHEVSSECAAGVLLFPELLGSPS